MSIISRVRIDQGSYIDEISGVAATKTGSVIKLKDDTNIGIALTNNGTTGNYVDIVGSEAYTNSGDWSVGILVYINKSGDQGVIGKRNALAEGWSLMFDGTNFRFKLNNATVASFTYSLRTWYLITITFVKNIQ